MTGFFLDRLGKKFREQNKATCARRARFARWLLTRLLPGRAPDLVIGPADRPYLRRWYLVPRNPALNIYLHHFLSSDDDRALHDHPWASVSLGLAGRYREHTIAAGGIHRRRDYGAGSVVWRLNPWAAHRIELVDDLPAWTLFCTGPRLRGWGFHCANGWRPWRDFTDATGARVGAGCGEKDDRHQARGARGDGR